MEKQEGLDEQQDKLGLRLVLDLLLESTKNNPNKADVHRLVTECRSKLFYKYSNDFNNDVKKMFYSLVKKLFIDMLSDELTLMNMKDLIGCDPNNIFGESIVITNNKKKYETVLSRTVLQFCAPSNVLDWIKNEENSEYVFNNTVEKLRADYHLQELKLKQQILEEYPQLMNLKEKKSDIIDDFEVNLLNDNNAFGMWRTQFNVEEIEKLVKLTIDSGSSPHHSVLKKSMEEYKHNDRLIQKILSVNTASEFIDMFNQSQDRHFELIGKIIIDILSEQEDETHTVSELFQLFKSIIDEDNIKVEGEFSDWSDFTKAYYIAKSLFKLKGGTRENIPDGDEYMARPVQKPLEGREDEYLPEECMSVLNQIVTTTYELSRNIKRLKELLINHNFITPETTYDTLVGDNKFNMLLFNSLLLQLPTNIQDSKYGEGIISDFNLIVDMTDTKLNQYLLKLYPNGCDALKNTLINNRRRFRKFLLKIKDAIIEGLELPETPDKTAVANEKKKQRKETLEQKKATKDIVLTTKDDIIQKQNKLLNVVSKPVVDELHDEESEADNDANPEKLVMSLVKQPDTSKDIMTFKPAQEKHTFLGRRLYDGKSRLDEFYTPIEAVEFILSFLNFDDDTYVWEPCCGKLNNIAKCLKANRINVFSSDVQDFRALELENYDDCIDFLNLLSRDPVDVNFVMTNPPWSQNKLFLQRLFRMQIPFCILIKMEVLASNYFQDAKAELPSAFPLYAVVLENKCAKFLNLETKKTVQVGKCIWLIGGHIPSHATELISFFETPGHKRSVPLVYHDKKHVECNDDGSYMSELTENEQAEMNEIMKTEPIMEDDKYYDEDGNLIDEDATINSALIEELSKVDVY